MAKKPPRIKSSIVKTIQEEQEKTKETQEKIAQDAKDPNKAMLIDIDKIGPLIANGEIMHNRSGMSSKDQDELKKFAESLLITKEGTLYGTGLLQAITVRPSKTKEGEYELIAGYRRTEAFKLNNMSQIPAIIVDVDDKTARRLRNNENKQRRALNAYDETYGDLEEIQLYCEFSSMEEAKKKIIRAANAIKKENSILKSFSEPLEKEKYEEIINSKSSYSLEEHYDSKELEKAVKEITQKTISTFCKRLEILKISDEIKKYLLNIGKVLPKPISYSEALSLKTVAKEDSTVVQGAVQWLEAQEKEKGKRPSSTQFEKWLKEETGYINKNRGNNKSPEKEIISSISNNLNEINIDSFSEEKKKQAKLILEEIESSISKLKNL